ncbi:MAG: efflux RND transporter periplasmic adaptor subunit [Alphaproteobacteria bacterium]|nr:efflux RND transporter periplasmic adaptor subunit [Alphaproteobacteria bacterium]
MTKRMIIMLILCALVLGSLFAYKQFISTMMMKHITAMSSVPVSVSSIDAEISSWQPEIRTVGSLRAVKGTDVAPEVAGMVENIFIDSGQDVTEGALLLQLRSADDRARLDSLIASRQLATLTFERSAKLLQVNGISQATYDADKANLDNLTAQVETQRALLEKKTILAPFSGRLGLRRVDIGQILSVGTTIVTLQQLDPIYIDFFVPQQSLEQLSVGQKVQATLDALPGEVFEGEILALEARIDTSTRNIEVRATLKNPDKKLRPGMFATVALANGPQQDFITLPQTAVTFNPYGSVVYVIKKGKDESGQDALRAHMTFVETGMTRGDQIAITKGIKKGDTVVTAGQMKLRNATVVTINNNIVPANDPNPLPEDR